MPWPLHAPVCTLSYPDCSYSAESLASAEQGPYNARYTGLYMYGSSHPGHVLHCHIPGGPLSL